MPRLPQPGADNGKWGEILNEFLSVSHTANGSLKTAAINKASVGLSDVDNTSDQEKPISNATQAALTDVNDKVRVGVKSLRVTNGRLIGTKIDDTEIDYGALPAGQNADDAIVAERISTGNLTQAALTTKIARGNANGTAPLDAGARVPDTNLPERLADTQGWLLAPAPAGTGLDDTETLINLATDARVANKGVRLRAGFYRIRNGIENVWPDGVPLVGEGANKTRFYFTVGSSLRFGLETAGNTETFYLEGIRFHGQGNAQTPVRIGRSVESFFKDIEILGGGAGAPALTIETTQNAIFLHCAVSANSGGGIKWSKGVNNILMIGCIVTKNHGYNHWFADDAYAGPVNPNDPEGPLPDQTPANIKIIGGLTEQPIDGPNVQINSGRLIQFIGSQCSRVDAAHPTILMQETTPSRPIGSVTWNAGQMRGFGGGAVGQRGTIARVIDGTLIVTGGTQIIGATTAFEISDNGKVVLGDHHQTNTVANLWAKYSSATKSLPELYEMGGLIYREVQTLFQVTSTTAVDLTNMGFYGAAGQRFEFECDLTVQGVDTDTDLAISWGYPTNATISWSILGLAENATSATSGGMRSRFSQASTPPKVGVITNQTVITIRGTVRMGDTAGTIIPRVAQGTAGGAVTIYTDSSLRARRLA